MDKQVLQQLISDGLTIPEISNKLNKSLSSVNRLLKKFGLKTKRFINRYDPDEKIRICRYCNKEQSIDCFPVSKTDKNGVVYRRQKCNLCYVAMKSNRRKNTASWLCDIKKTLCCNICNNNDFRVLEFHHKTDNKEFNIADAINFSKEKILKEIAKCDVLCSNCHRIITYEERNRSVG